MTTAVLSVPEAQPIEVAKLRESASNPRKHFDKTSIQELADSIAEQGILVPLTVRFDVDSGHFEIVCGSRRFRAAQIAGLKALPCIVRVLSDQAAAEVAMVDNLQREDVHPLEEAAAYAKMQKQFGYSLGQIANQVGKTPAYVQQRLILQSLIEPAKKIFYEKRIGVGHALLVARLQPDQQKQCIHDLRDDISVSGLKSSIEREFFLNLNTAPFDTKDAKLVPKAGSCVDCPKRTGFNKLLFPDIKETDTCTDPVCFDVKVQAFIKIQIKENPKAVHLAIGSQYDADRGAKGITGWVKAKDKNCPNVIEGIVVQQIAHYPSDAQKAALGTVLKVCTNEKCKTHRETYSSGSGGSSEWSKKQAAKMKVRKLELRRRGLIFNNLATNRFVVNDHDYREVLDWQIETISHDHAKALCDAMGWEPKKGQYIGKDFHGTVKKQLADVTSPKRGGAAIAHWIYLLMLASTDLWFSTGGQPAPKMLEAKAKAVKVPLAEIAKLAKQKPKKVKAPTAKKAAANDKKETAA